MPSGELIVGALLAVNGVLFGLLVYGVLGRGKPPEPSNLREAFASLEAAIRRAVPDLPSGFTWEEAVARLRSLGVDTGGMEGALMSYEAYRYGGEKLPEADYRDVVRVAKALGWRGAGKRRGVNIGI